MTSSTNGVNRTTSNGLTVHLINRDVIRSPWMGGGDHGHPIVAGRHQNPRYVNGHVTVVGQGRVGYDVHFEVRVRVGALRQAPPVD